MQVGGERISDRFLIVRAGGRLCALRIGDVIEIMRPLPLEPLCGMPAFLLGACIVRGDLAPVVDCAALVGAGSGACGRYVRLRAGETRCAILAVESVLSVRVLDSTRLRELPPLLRAADSGIVSAVSTLDTELLLVLRDARLVPEDVWSAIESKVAPA